MLSPSPAPAPRPRPRPRALARPSPLARAAAAAAALSPRRTHTPFLPRAAAAAAPASAPLPTPTTPLPLLGDTCAVVGASLAGLLAAAAVAPRYRRVVVLDKDPSLPLGANSAAPRRGVPQSTQPHVLFAGGLAAMERLLPGVGADLAAAGAAPIDWLSQFAFCEAGTGLSAPPAGAEPGPPVRSFSCSRFLLEAVARGALLRAHRNVELRPGSRVAGLLLRRGSDDGGGAESAAVAGVRLSCGSELGAALTVDASGRGSHCSDWLAAAGVPPSLADPPVQRVDAGLGYATRLFTLPPGRPWPSDSVVVLLSHEPPHARRLFYVARLEGRRLVATLGGYDRDWPPCDPAGWDAFGAALGDGGAFARALAGAEPDPGPAQALRATANVRRLWAPLAGLAHVGDAATALCPAYGQGMSIAALGAEALGAAVARAADGATGGDIELAAAGCGRHPAADRAWAMAAGRDAGFAHARGGSGAGGDGDGLVPALVGAHDLPAPLAWYFRALRRRAFRDSAVFATLTRVAHLVQPGAELLRPALAARILAAELREAAGVLVARRRGGAEVA